MRQANARAQLTLRFDERWPDSVLDPSRALADLVRLLSHLEPARLIYRHIIEPDYTDILLDVAFEERAASCADLLREALILAEGEAGFRTVEPRLPAPDGPSWSVAQLMLRDVTVAGHTIALPLPIAHAQAAIGRELRLTGAAHGYQLDAMRWAGDVALARRLVRPLAAVEQAARQDAAFPVALRDAMRLAGGIGWDCAEGICLRTDANDAVAMAVESALIDCAIDRYPFLTPDLLHIEWGPLERAGGARSFEEIVASLRDRNFVAPALGHGLKAASDWRWPSESLPKPEPEPELAQELLAAPARLGSGDAFAFLSYAHRDAPHVRTALNALAGRGVRIWHDSSIEAGERWDEILERRIRDCALLIACVSPAYEDSRFCRREIKFADFVEKPILPLSVAEYSWGEGLTLMFQELQIIDGRAEGAIDRVVARLGALAPHCIAPSH